MMRPHPWRRVWAAAQRVGAADERGSVDEWTRSHLRRCRAEALKGGMSEEEVDNATMTGMLAGRREASE